jgi:hypothetical protein
VTFSVEYLEGERLAELWGQIKPLFVRSCEEAAHGEITAADIFNLTYTKQAHVFVELEDGAVTVAIAIEVTTYPRTTMANIIALGGNGLLAARDRWWKVILEWLVANNATAVDAWVAPGMRRILERKFNFRHVYHHMRLDIGEAP